MHYAMREARIQIANMEEGVATWGAYQHYGNPFLRFFNPASFKPEGVGSDGGSNGDGRATTVVFTGASSSSAAAGNGGNGNSRPRAARKRAAAKKRAPAKTRRA